jgi:hypothetical protein
MDEFMNALTPESDHVKFDITLPPFPPPLPELLPEEHESLGAFLISTLALEDLAREIVVAREPDPEERSLLRERLINRVTLGVLVKDHLTPILLNWNLSTPDKSALDNLLSAMNDLIELRNQVAHRLPEAVVGTGGIDDLDLNRIPAHKNLPAVLIEDLGSHAVTALRVRRSLHDLWWKAR